MVSTSFQISVRFSDKRQSYWWRRADNRTSLSPLKLSFPVFGMRRKLNKIKTNLSIGSSNKSARMYSLVYDIFPPFARNNGGRCRTGSVKAKTMRDALDQSIIWLTSACSTDYELRVLRTHNLAWNSAQSILRTTKRLGINSSARVGPIVFACIYTRNSIYSYLCRLALPITQYTVDISNKFVWHHKHCTDLQPWQVDNPSDLRTSCGRGRIS